MLDVCPISIAFLTQNISMLPKKLSSWALLEAYYQMHSLKAETAIFRNSLRRLQACLNREQNRVSANLNSVKDCRRASYEMVRHCTKLTLLHPLGCHCFETQEKRTNSGTGELSHANRGAASSTGLSFYFSFWFWCHLAFKQVAFEWNQFLQTLYRIYWVPKSYFKGCVAMWLKKQQYREKCHQ